MEDCFQGADLAESGTLTFLTFFLTVVWILVVMAGTPAVVLDNHVTLEKAELPLLKRWFLVSSDFLFIRCSFSYGSKQGAK